MFVRFLLLLFLRYLAIETVVSPTTLSYKGLNKFSPQNLMYKNNNKENLIFMEQNSFSKNWAVETGFNNVSRH